MPNKHSHLDRSLQGRTPIRVLYLQPCASFGGAERQASIVIPLLREWGVEVVPLVGPAQTIVRWLEEQGVDEIVHSQVFPGGWPRSGPLGRALLPARYLASVRAVAAEVDQLIQERAIDLVYAAMPFSWIAATQPARRHGKPVVWRAGGTMIHPLERPLLRAWAALHPPDLLLCCSQAVHDTFAPLVAAPAEVVENGVELQRFRPGRGDPARFRPPEARLVVGYAARMAPEKRPEDFVELAARVAPRHPGVVFLVAGEGSRRSYCEALARSRGVEQVVHFLGYVEDVRSFYAACDVLTLPSRSEGLPNMVLESMSMQKALVVTDRVARTGVLRHEQEGLVYVAGDVAAFTEQVERLIESETLRLALARRAHERVRREFDVIRSARRIARMLHALHAWSGRGAAVAGSGRLVTAPT
jgi:glycosyltransferase involved in cell wall biosynthesis